MNILHTLTQGDPVVIAVLGALIAMSVISWYILLWKGFSLRADRRALQQFRRKYTTQADWPKHVTSARVNGMVDMLTDEAERLKPVIASYAHEERQTILSMHLIQALDLAKVQLDKGLTMLASVGSTSPFIGLFGTVWGITGALAKITAEGNAGLTAVAGPVGEALVATAVGLFAAIPAVLAYNAFVRMNRVHVQDLRHIAEQMTVYIPLRNSTSRFVGDNIQLVRD
ncbi:MAG TPA: MotA/TolQ/ExbB proton channel family protein [Rickettsiales bacterium]|nr:MotA/TolQ/ExbB proton channel family protein [Rickettsiales bacterium]